MHYSLWRKCTSCDPLIWCILENYQWEKSLTDFGVLTNLRYNGKIVMETSSYLLVLFLFVCLFAVFCLFVLFCFVFWLHDHQVWHESVGIRKLRGYCTSGPYFWRLCAFSQKIKQLRTKYPMDLVRNVPRNSKITVLLNISRDHCCEVTVKNVQKSIFSMFWAINQ